MARWIWAIVAVTLVLLSLGTIVLVRWLTSSAAVTELPAIAEVETVSDVPLAIVTTTTESETHVLTVQTTRIWNAGTDRKVTAKFSDESKPDTNTTEVTMMDGTALTMSNLSRISISNVTAVDSLLAFKVSNETTLSGFQATGVGARVQFDSVYRSIPEVVVDDRGHGLLFYNPNVVGERKDVELWVYDMHSKTSTLFATQCWSFDAHWRDGRLYVAIMSSTLDKIIVFMGKRTTLMSQVELTFDAGTNPTDARVRMVSSPTHIMVICRGATNNVSVFVLTDNASSTTPLTSDLTASANWGENIALTFEAEGNRFWFGTVSRVFTCSAPFTTYEDAGVVFPDNTVPLNAIHYRSQSAMLSSNNVTFFISTDFDDDTLLLWKTPTATTSWSAMTIASVACTGMVMRMYDGDLYIVCFETASRSMRVAVCAGPNYATVGAFSDLGTVSSDVDAYPKIWFDSQGSGITLQTTDDLVNWAPLWPVLSTTCTVSNSTTVTNYSITGEPSYYTSVDPL
jgi:hypothetical protein